MKSPSSGSWLEIFKGGIGGIFARRVHVENASIISAVWAGTGLGAAPNPALYVDGAIGVSNNGDGAVDTAYNIYLVMPDGSGGKVWKPRAAVTLENILGA